MKQRFLAPMAGLMLVAGAALAAPETYTIDSRHTFPSFEVNHLGLSTYRGRFDKTSGTITLDMAAKKGSADIKIEVGSVSTGVDGLDKHLLKDDFFDAEKFPDVTFKSDNFTFKGDKLASVKGNLTMRGVTRPVTLTVTAFACKEHPMMKGKQVCGVDAETTVKRTDFGINYGVPNVGENVKIKLQIEAFKN